MTSRMSFLPGPVQRLSSSAKSAVGLREFFFAVVVFFRSTSSEFEKKGRLLVLLDVPLKQCLLGVNPEQDLQGGLLESVCLCLFLSVFSLLLAQCSDFRGLLFTV